MVKIFESLGRVIIGGLSILMLYYLRLTYFITPDYYPQQSEVVFYTLSIFLIIWILLPVLDIEDI